MKNVSSLLLHYLYYLYFIFAVHFNPFLILHPTFFGYIVFKVFEICSQNTFFGRKCPKMSQLPNLFPKTPSKEIVALPIFEK